MHEFSTQNQMSWTNCQNQITKYKSISFIQKIKANAQTANGYRNDKEFQTTLFSWTKEVQERLKGFTVCESSI